MTPELQAQLRHALATAAELAPASAQPSEAHGLCCWQGETVVAVTSGANMNFDRLRLVAELAGVGATQEAMLVTTIPELPGSFTRFTSTALADSNLSITEFKYRWPLVLGRCLLGTRWESWQKTWQLQRSSGAADATACQRAAGKEALTSLLRALSTMHNAP